ERVGGERALRKAPSGIVPPGKSTLGGARFPVAGNGRWPPAFSCRNWIVVGDAEPLERSHSDRGEEANVAAPWRINRAPHPCGSALARESPSRPASPPWSTRTGRVIPGNLPSAIARVKKTGQGEAPTGLERWISVGAGISAAG